MTIYSTAFVNNGSGVYEQDWYTGQVLTQDGFLDTDMAQALDNTVFLKAGQSIQFKLPPVMTYGKVENDVFYFLEICLDYPGSDTTYTMGLLPFKLDNTAVDAYFADQAPSFTDVPENAYYAEPVAWAVENGITNGTSSTTFSPAQNCTHAQILTFLWRAAGKPSSSAKAPVTVADAYAGAVNWAYKKGMINNSFNPNANCTRLDAVNYIWLAFDKPAAVDCNFTDISLTAHGGAAVKWAVFKGATNGTSETTFSPDKVCSRGEIVTFLYRAYH